MVGLPRSIIKKYGVTKKAWSVFRSRSSSSTRAAKVTQVARRKGRRSSGGKKKSSGFKGAALTTGAIVGAMAYGAGRQYVSDKLSNYVPNFAGEWTDEVVMGMLSYFMAKGKIPLLDKIPYSKEIGKAGLAIEAARVGAALMSKVNVTSTSPSAQATVTVS